MGEEIGATAASLILVKLGEQDRRPPEACRIEEAKLCENSDVLHGEHREPKNDEKNFGAIKLSGAQQRRTSVVEGITMPMVEPHFNLPLKGAAQELGIRCLLKQASSLLLM
jgi:hypothetical protein